MEVDLLMPATFTYGLFFFLPHFFKNLQSGIIFFFNSRYSQIVKGTGFEPFHAV